MDYCSTRRITRKDFTGHKTDLLAVMRPIENQGGMLNAIQVMLEHKKRVGDKNRKERRKALRPNTDIANLIGKDRYAALQENARRREKRMQTSMIIRKRPEKNARV